MAKRNLIYMYIGREIKYGAILLIFIFSLSLLAYGSETRTYVTLEAGGKPAADTVKFIAYYNNDNNYILTEDSYNSPYVSLLENGGYWVTPGYCRSEGLNWPPTHATNGDTYTIWVSATANNQWGTASGSYNDTVAHYTTPGTSANRLILSSTNYLGEPGSFEATPGSNKVLLKWNPVTGSSGYRLYRRLAATPDNDNHWRAYYKVANISGGTTNYYIDNTASDGTNYRYILVAEATGPARIGPHTNEIGITPESTGAPSLESLSPLTGPVGTLVTITGINLGTAAGTVEFNGVKATNVIWSGGGTVITAEVPVGATSGLVYLINSSGLASNGIDFTVSGGTGASSYEGSGGMMVAYPNPFNTKDVLNPLKMQFHALAGKVEIFIIDEVGKIVQKMDRSYITPTDTAETWDGSSTFGGKVPNGIYLIRVVQGGKVVAKGKIIAIKR